MGWLGENVARRATFSHDLRLTTRLPAAVDPLLQMRLFGTDGGVGTVAGTDEGVVGQDEEFGGDALDDLGEAVLVAARRAGAAGEEGVAGDEGLAVEQADA